VTLLEKARRMKILQTNFHLEWNGQVARVFLLSRELLQRGHSVVIAAPAASALAARARAAGRLRDWPFMAGSCRAASRGAIDRAADRLSIM